MALTRNVVDIVLAEAEKVHATEVKSVHVTVGEVRDIIDDIFVDMFGWLARGTVAEHAEVVLTRVPLTVECKECGHIYHLNVFDESTWPCPKCGKRNYVLRTGREFFISNIEVVSPNPPANPEPSPEDEASAMRAMMAKVAAANRAEAERAAAEEAAGSADAPSEATQA